MKYKVRRNLAEVVGLAALITFFFVAPLFLGEYVLGILTKLCISAIIAISFRLVVTMGRWSFGHLGAMGVGAYTTALLTTKYFSLPFWLTLPIGGAAAMAFALIISYPCLRTRGFYFFLSTFAAAEATRQAYIVFPGIFGGNRGIAHIPPPTPILGISFSSPASKHWIILGFAILFGAIMYWLEKGRIGQTAKAIASSDSLMKSVGVNTYKYETIVLAIAFFFAGMAGVFHVHYYGFIHPFEFAPVHMFSVLTWAILGGTASFAGPLIGLAVVTAYSEALRDIAMWVPLIHGAIILTVLMVLPGGLESIPKRIQQMRAGKVMKSLIGGHS